MKPLLPIALLLLTNVTKAQSSPSQAAPAFSSSGAFLGISVPDLDASTRWYVEKLGMRVVFQPPVRDGYAVRVLQGAGFMVELLHNAAAAPLRTLAPSVSHTTLVHGIFKGGVIVDDYDRTLAVLRERGADIAIGPFPARDGVPANFIVRDNAGNLIQFFGR
jgi:catechol 2,3-dioxygenase-like lactoylglutathione lyase family enzyme